MKRDQAFKFASEVADAGYSCAVELAVTPRMHPREHCAVRLHALRFDSVQLQRLIELGKPYNVDLHLIDSNLRFVERAPFADIR